MSTRKTTLFYGLLIGVSSLSVGMVIASRLDMTPTSSAQTLAVPPMNSSPITGTLDALNCTTIGGSTSPLRQFVIQVLLGFSWLHAEFRGNSELC